MGLCRDSDCVRVIPHGEHAFRWHLWRHPPAGPYRYRYLGVWGCWACGKRRGRRVHRTAGPAGPGMVAAGIALLAPWLFAMGYYCARYGWDGPGQSVWLAVYIAVGGALPSVLITRGLAVWWQPGRYPGHRTPVRESEDEDTW